MIWKWNPWTRCFVQALADQHGYTFIECSARENINVIPAFEAIAHEIVEQWKLNADEEEDGEDNETGLDVGRKDNAEPKKKCC